jgi:predicted deacylase
MFNVWPALVDADILVDMHSAGIYCAMPTLVGFCDDGSVASLEAARLADAAGMPVIWRQPGPPAAGRTGTGPHLRGVPFLYFESTDDQDQAEVYADAILRIMAASGMIDEAPAKPAAKSVRLFGPGDLDVGGIIAERTGLISTDVDVLDHVGKGQVLAHILDPATGTIEPALAHTDGIVVMHRRTASVAEENLVAFLAAPDVADGS